MVHVPLCFNGEVASGYLQPLEFHLIERNGFLEYADEEMGSPIFTGRARAFSDSMIRPTDWKSGQPFAMPLNCIGSEQADGGSLQSREDDQIESAPLHVSPAAKSTTAESKTLPLSPSSSPASEDVSIPLAVCHEEGQPWYVQQVMQPSGNCFTASQSAKQTDMSQLCSQLGAGQVDHLFPNASPAYVWHQQEMWQVCPPYIVPAIGNWQPPPQDVNQFAPFHQVAQAPCYVPVADSASQDWHNPSKFLITTERLDLDGLIGDSTVGKESITKIENIGCDAQKQTTVQLHNFPSTWTRDAVLDILDSRGFKGRYRFVYLPMNFSMGGCLGYADICMCSVADAVDLSNKLHGLEIDSVGNSFSIAATWSDQDRQSIEDLIARYRDSPVMHRSVPDAHRPALFEDGARIKFPPPTKPLKRPRIRPVKT
jgi:hypothetical protein